MGRKAYATMPIECGGINSTMPLVVGALTGLPVVDADGMGRAFPEVPQVAMHLAGISPSPAVMTDERGNIIMFRTISGDWVERLERAAAAEFGGNVKFKPDQRGLRHRLRCRIARVLGIAHI